MKIAYLDFWTGLGGDMLVGALLDAGWPEERLFAVVRALKLGPTEVTVERRTQRGMTGLGIRVRANHDPHERHLHEIEALIGAADLPAPAKAAAIRTFRALGEVEARVHGIPIEQVHFHEIGAADSIVDIVAAAVALHDLGVERLEAGVIPMTTGFVEMDHGRLPVPAPATALLLAGWPLRPVAIEGEFFTPTAAALIATLARHRGSLPAMTVERVGYGAGTRPHPELPNLVRLWIGEVDALDAVDDPAGAGEHDRVVVLETQLDDMEPRMLATLCEDLLGAGALDVYRTPITMKKGRLATLLTVIAPPELADGLALRILDGSTTLGVRTREERRRVLPRRFESVETEWGPVSVKWAEAPSGPRMMPEHDDIVRLARSAGVSPALLEGQVRRIVWEAGLRNPGEPGTTR